MKRILILNGPNLNLLGKREPEIYGSTTLDILCKRLKELGQSHGAEVTCIQSNVEGELINAIQDYGFDSDAIIFNPGGYTHTSVAIRDAIAAVPTPVYEVHISHPESREAFRKTSLIREVCAGGISGFGVEGYALVLKHLISGQ